MKKLFRKRWGKWTDISTGQYSHYNYILQVKRHINGKVKFRVAKSDCAWFCITPTLEQLSDIDEDTK